MLKALTLDFWNTLYRDVSFSERFKGRVEYLQKELSRLGYKRTGLEIERAVELAGKEWMHMWSALAKSFKPIDITGTALRNLDLNLPVELTESLSNGLSEVALKYPPILVEGAVDFLKVASKKFKLGLISDTAVTAGTVLRRIMKNSEIDSHFEVYTFSDEMNTTKPDKENFMQTLKMLNVEPQEAVHIGDMERTDIKGAKAVGMKAILFTAVNNKDVKDTSADLIITSFEGLSERLEKF